MAASGPVHWTSWAPSRRPLEAVRQSLSCGPRVTRAHAKDRRPAQSLNPAAWASPWNMRTVSSE